MATELVTAKRELEFTADLVERLEQDVLARQDSVESLNAELSNVTKRSQSVENDLTLKGTHAEG